MFKMPVRSVDSLEDVDTVVYQTPSGLAPGRADHCCLTLQDSLPQQVVADEVWWGHIRCETTAPRYLQTCSGN